MVRFGLMIAAVLWLFVSPAPAATDPSLSDTANAAYLKDNAAKPGTVVLPSGLQYTILQSGFGRHPGVYDTVSVYYSGKLINGNAFDATEPGLPAQLELDKLIAGWREALSIMRVGDHWRLVIPSGLGYGSRGAGNGRVPPNQTLVFDLQLVDTAAPPPKEKDDDNK
jgi:FKBP-type peptidyl-prolyl cis-trans isomerase